MKARFISWEDGIIAVLVLVWLTVGFAMAQFHIYSVVLMMLILSIGLSKGLLAAFSRVTIISVILFSVSAWRGKPHSVHLADMFAMLICSVLAGFLGDRERRTKDALKSSFSQSLEALARALEARDSYTEGHSRRTAKIAVILARRLGSNKRILSAVEQAGLLHDLGKIGTPDDVLHKSGSLTPDERHLMEQHPIVGNQILKGVAFLEEASILVRHHHERYDGSGYPDGLAGSKIPIGSRILAVADVLDALTTDRPYHKALDFESAVKKMKGDMAHLFDPVVLGALDHIDLQQFGPQLSEASRVLVNESNYEATSKTEKELQP